METPKVLITLSDSEKKAIVRLKTEADQIANAVSQYALALRQAQKNFEVATDALQGANLKVQEAITTLAFDNGVDLKLPNAGQWNFSFETLELRRTDLPATPPSTEPDPPKNVVPGAFGRNGGKRDKH